MIIDPLCSEHSELKACLASSSCAGSLFLYLPGSSLEDFRESLHKLRAFIASKPEGCGYFGQFAMAMQADPNLLSRFNAGFSGCPMDQVNRRKGLRISWIHTVKLYSFPMFLDLWHHSVLTVEAEKNPKTCSFPVFLSLIHRLEPSIPRPVAELRTHWSGASCKGLGGAEKVKGWMRIGWSWWSLWSWWSWWSLVWYWCILFLYFMYISAWYFYF